MWNLLVPALAILGGTSISAYTNKAAADKASQASLQGAQITADAIREGQATLEQVRQEAKPAQNYLRTVMATPAELTGDQQTQLEEARRAVGNQIRSSGFAGSGRTGAALFRKVETDFVNDALDRNRQRADQAAGTLAAPATSAATGIANLQSAGGKVIGDATAKGGLYDAQSDLATGNLTGRALGDIGSLISNQQRESRYADRLSAIEKSLKSTA